MVIVYRIGPQRYPAADGAAASDLPRRGAILIIRPVGSIFRSRQLRNLEETLSPSAITEQTPSWEQ